LKISNRVNPACPVYPVTKCTGVKSERSEDISSGFPFSRLHSQKRLSVKESTKPQAPPIWSLRPYPRGISMRRGRQITNKSQWPITNDQNIKSDVLKINILEFVSPETPDGEIY